MSQESSIFKYDGQDFIRMRRDSDVARRTVRDRHSQPLTGSPTQAQAGKCPV